MKRKAHYIICLFSALLLLASCDSPSPPAATAVSTMGPTRTAVSVPPTFTPDSKAPELVPTQPLVTVTQPTVTPTATDIPYGDTILQLHLRIPAIGLDRRLQGSISSQIILVDENTGTAVQRNNQALVLLDLQGLLPDLDLEPVPDGCDTCVQFSFSLELENVSREGWLQDKVLLASLENYFSINLGPHYPPDSYVALRRSASPYAPAHTVAATRDGLLYTWLANATQVDPPAPADPQLIAAFNALAGETLAPQYIVRCPGSALETLYIASPDNEWRISLECPEYALPRKLQPLYIQLNAPLQALLAGSESTLARPPARLPIDGVIVYERLDGAELTILADNTVLAITPIGEMFSTTISAETQIALLTDILNSGEVRPGLKTFDVIPTPTGTVLATSTPRPARSRLLVRGLEAVYDGAWTTFNPPVLTGLNNLYNLVIAGEGAEDAGADDAGAEDGGAAEGTGTGTLAGTPTPGGTAPPSPGSPTATPDG